MAEFRTPGLFRLAIKPALLISLAAAFGQAGAEDHSHPTHEQLAAGQALLDELKPFARMSSLLPRDAEAKFGLKLQADDPATGDSGTGHLRRYHGSHAGSLVSADYTLVWGFQQNNRARLLLNIHEPEICITESMMNAAFQGLKPGEMHVNHPFHMKPGTPWPEGLRVAPADFEFVNEVGMSIDLGFFYACAQSIAIEEHLARDWAPADTGLQ